MEEMRWLISVLALGLGVWNYLRLRKLDQKGEYKDKRNLYQECLGEAKDLIEKIDLGVNQIESLREEFYFIDSPYQNSSGSKQGHEALMEKLRDIHKIKEEILILYRSLNDIVSLEDKAAFDSCIDIRKKLKDHFIEVSPLMGKTKILIERMIKMANSQASNA